MQYQLEISEQDKEEMIEFFKKKQERLLKDLKAVENTLAKLLGKANGIKENAVAVEPKQVVNRDSVPWKYKIDGVLKQSPKPMPASKILSQLIDEEPEIKERLEAARKSLASALSSNSKDANDRYIRIIDKGLSYYSLNEKFVE